MPSLRIRWSSPGELVLDGEIDITATDVLGGLEQVRWLWLDGVTFIDVRGLGHLQRAHAAWGCPPVSGATSHTARLLAFLHLDDQLRPLPSADE